MTRVRIENIRRARREHGRFVTYCEVVDAETGELLINATLDYALAAIADRGWVEEGPK